MLVVETFECSWISYFFQVSFNLLEFGMFLKRLELRWMFLNILVCDYFILFFFFVPILLFAIFEQKMLLNFTSVFCMTDVFVTWLRDSYECPLIFLNLECSWKYLNYAEMFLNILVSDFYNYIIIYFRTNFAVRNFCIVNVKFHFCFLYDGRFCHIIAWLLWVLSCVRVCPVVVCCSDRAENLAGRAAALPPLYSEKKVRW